MQNKHNSSNGVSRNIALQGEPAALFLAARGIIVTGEQKLRVIGDELSAINLRIARIWQSTSKMTIAPRTLSRIVFQAEGSASVVRHRDRRIEHVRPEMMLFLQPRETYTVEYHQPAARYEIDFDTEFVGGRLAQIDLLERSDVTHTFRSILISSLSFILNSTVHPEDEGFWKFRDSMVSLAMATLLQSFNAEEKNEWSRAAELHRTAKRLIGERFVDPDFGVEVLAKELHITRRHLSRVFSEAGDLPPGSVLRAQRVRHARQLLRMVEAPRRTRLQIAQQSGFRSQQVLRRALESTGDDDTSTDRSSQASAAGEPADQPASCTGVAERWQLFDGPAPRARPAAG